MDRRPLVIGSAPAFVGEMPSGDTLPAAIGGLGADASGWASGKVPVFDGTKFGPGDAGGLPSGGAKSQVLVQGESAAEWGVVAPVVTGGGPYRGVYDPQTTYAVDDVVSYAEVDTYGGLQYLFFAALAAGTLPDPFSSLGTSWTDVYPAVSGSVSLGDGAIGVDTDVAIGTGACAYYPPPSGPFTPSGGSGVSIGYLSSLKGSASTAVGATAFADSSTAVGAGALAVTESVAIGTYARSFEGSIAIGSGVATNGNGNGAYNIAIGYGIYSFAAEACTVIGAGVYVETDVNHCTVVGAYSVAYGEAGVGIGVGVSVTHDRAAIIGGQPPEALYAPMTTAARRMTVDYQDIEVDDQELYGQTGVILRDEIGGQWRITVNSSGVISAASL